jgi:phosphatidylglycerophosphate synthase
VDRSDHRRPRAADPRPARRRRRRRHRLSAVDLGKLKTNVQFVAIFLAIVQWGGASALCALDEWLLLAAAVITVASAVEYIARFSSALRETPH